MSEHTPGPWKLLPGRNQHYLGKVKGVDYEATMQRCYYLAGPGRRGSLESFVADLIVSVPGDREADGDANARLIAAAPDMLGACKRAIEYLENCTDEPDCWCDELREGFSAPEEDLKTLNCVACQLRASIAMAESK